MNVVFISALRGVVKRHSAASLPSVPSNTEKRGYGPIQLQKTESLFDLIDKIDPIGVVESEKSNFNGVCGTGMFGFIIYIRICSKGPRKQFVHTKCKSCPSLY
ncbi:hypothetical protein CK203_068055 [Vitis vinifera]|uniref:Uncharacterized protein n=1 Tax=Vitis vinifera TaxID=29760 RepID=A0A438EWC1_VITVI|nr:hypothetical protein CK203_068055 [Vitis vinifera]